MTRFATIEESPDSLVTTTVLYQSAMGLGGVGKTQLAARYVHLCLAQQQAIASRELAADLS